ncbi:MAG: maleylacetoacetate isomerase [Alphaproteobacteria bacterium]|nr:maleylacetoacetate isomerase [Alphaproteobacteria bacterium]
MRLYDYWRSTAAYRVRIALHFKGLEFEQIPIDLRADGQRAEDYLAINPQGLVPYFEDGDLAIGQSLAIIDYLEETHPEPPVLPGDPKARARIRAVAQTIASDIHPLNNLRVLQYLERDLGCDQLKRMIWYHRWVADGFKAIEVTLKESAGEFCCGDEPTLADICLAPQVYNAKRYEVDLGPFPTIRTINDRCQELEAFAKAAPQHQPGS